MSWKTAFIAHEANYSDLEAKHRATIYTVFSERELSYSGDWNFRQYFYARGYLGHPWPLYKNFTEIVPGEPLRRGS